MPRRKLSQQPERNEPTRSPRRKMESILTQRERLVADIALLRARGDTSRFIDNAQQLLTRWWSTSNWNAREELLKSAGWLIQLEKRRGGEVHLSA